MIVAGIALGAAMGIRRPAPVAEGARASWLTIAGTLASFVVAG